jgi:shikimate kinase
MTTMRRARPASPEASLAATLKRPIVLVGLMGAGKSSIGRLLAVRLGLEFVDADSEIENAAGAGIEEIFATHGEAAFRSGERRVITRLLKGRVRVVATGGGAFMDEDTRAQIKAGALSVWLKADLDTLLKRVSRRGGRPLLKDNDPRDVMAALMAERDPVYAEADITVETAENPPAEVADRVVAALAIHLGLKLPPAKRNHGPRDGAPGNGPGKGGRNHQRRRSAAPARARAKQR